MQLVRQ